MKASEKKSLFAAYFILFLDNFGFAVVFPIFPILFLNAQEGILPAATLESTRNLLLGLLLAMFPLAQFLGAPFFGDCADRFGRKKVFVWTIGGTILGYVLTAFAIQGQLFSLLLVSRIVTGFFAGNLALCMAVIADCAQDEKQRSKDFGIVAMFLGLSWISAVIIGAIFTNPQQLSNFNPAIPFWVIAILSVASLVVLKIFYTETHPGKASHKLDLLKGVHNILHVLDSKKLRGYYATLFLWFLGFFLTTQWAAPIALQKFKVGQMSIMWLFVATGLVWALATGVFNRLLINRFSLQKVTLWALIVMAIFFFFGGVSDYFPYYAIAYTIGMTCGGIAWNDTMSLISLASGEEGQGRTMGIAQSTMAFSQFLAPILGGVIARYTVEPIFYVGAFLVFVAFFLLLALTKRVD